MTVKYLKNARPRSFAVDGDVKATVAQIIEDVESEGIAAVRRYSARFDCWDPRTFAVSAAQVESCPADVDADLRRHIEFAASQIRTFAEHQLSTMRSLSVETAPGVELGHRLVPVNAVGAYSPGGRYPLIASALMTVITPKVAGVERVVACAPPNRDSGAIHPAQLYAMSLAGADEIYCLGGVQALAALALGVEGIEPVDMLVGAGNAYVAEAKRQLMGRVGIDLLAGPTEILVIADDSADPRVVAADLLGQAEHGPTSPAVLITDCEGLGSAVLEEVEKWLATWPTAEVAGTAWAELGEIVICEDQEEMASASDRYAPEHLELQTRNDDWFAERLTNYGTLFIGPASTVVYSDKAIGTNHVLPTAGAARYTGGLWVGKFIKTLTYQRVSSAGIPFVAPAAAAIAEAESMLGHAITARLRLGQGEGLVSPAGADQKPSP